VVVAVRKREGISVSENGDEIREEQETPQTD
jgi:hypothetical protein